MKNEKYVDLILSWAKERKIDQQIPAVSLSKVVEEISETLTAIEQKDKLEIKDGLGDIAITLINYFNSMHIFNVDEIKTFVSEESITNDKKMSETNIDYRFNTIVKNLGKLQSGFVLRNQKDNQKQLTEYAKQIFQNLEMIIEFFNLNLNTVLEFCYNEIKDRDGKIIENVYVKNADLKNN